LVTYPDDGIRLAISRAVVKENARGLQITKEKSAHKIDLVITLAMAAYAAVQQSHVEEVPIVVPYRGNFRSVSRFSEYRGGVLRLWRLTRSFCARMVSIKPKVVN
jgi:hypothetical protein